MIARLNWVLAVALCLAGCEGSTVVPVADDRYQPNVSEPAYPSGQGPLVRIDAAHANYHTATGRYAPFAKLLRADGCRVTSFEELGPAAFQEVDVFVVANAMPSATGGAFTALEVRRIADFVATGGGLLIVTDHPPFPAAVSDLAAAFGVELVNAIAVEFDAQRRILPSPAVFRRADGRIGEHPITGGRNDVERIGQLATFAGTAFPANGKESLFHFGSNAGVMFPQHEPNRDPHRAAEREPNGSRHGAAGWSQGVALSHGKGRVVILGEAGMLSAQRPAPEGLLSKQARDNEQFALNVIRWLARTL